MHLFYYDEKLCELAKLQGFHTVKELLTDNLNNEGSVDGLCMNCDHVQVVEPDCDKGFCRNCQSHSVMSCFEMTKHTNMFSELTLEKSRL